MLTELKLLQYALLRIVAWFFVLVLGFLFVTIPKVNATVASLAVQEMNARFVPEGATLAVFSPLDPFLTLATVAGMLAFLATIPLVFSEFWDFVAPALHPRERRMLAVGILGALGLTALGAAFSFFFLVPIVFNELFAFLPFGVEPIFGLRQLIAVTVGFTLISSLLFLLPLVMVLLTYARLVPSPFWLTYSRHAVLLTLIASAIITPDGSGVSMLLLSLPICGLYAAGYAGAKAVSIKGRSIRYKGGG